MDTVLLVVLVVLVLALLTLVGLLLVIQFRKPATTSADISTPLQNLTQTIQEVRVQTASLTAGIQAKAEFERQTSDSIKRLEMIIAGSSSKGAAGERVLEELLAKLPTEWQVRNFRVNNKPVEFGLRLPNNLILPIDSKWAATGLLEQFSNSSDPDEQKKLQEQIEGVVIGKANEVGKYIDPTITFPFGIAVVPDAVYSLCPAVNIETSKHNVVVVSYSLFLPYLLLVFQTALATSRTIDTEKLNTHLQTVEQSVTAVQAEIENRFSKALTMLDISRRELKAHIGKASNALTSVRINAGQTPMTHPEITDGK